MRQHSWQGDLLLPDGKQVTDLHLISSSRTELLKLQSAKLEFLSLVEISLVPLHLVCGAPLRVETGDDATQAWFCEALLDEDGVSKHPPWQSTDQFQSTLGVLVQAPKGSVVGGPVAAGLVTGGIKVTEVLFLAQRKAMSAKDDEFHSSSSQQSDIALYALPLCSDLLYRPSIIEGLSEPDDGEAYIIPSPSSMEKSKKRERIGMLFDSLEDRQREAKKRRKQSISANHTRKSSTDLDWIKQEPDEDKLIGSAKRRIQPVAVSQNARSASQRGRVSVGTFGDASVEEKNKQIISRTVMAGMRLYGLQQRKRLSKRDKSVIEIDSDNDDDAEFKAVYHQTYKSTAFAMRLSIEADLLRAEDVQEVVDKLLVIFCASR